MIYADIIVDISHEKLDRSFQYRVPKELEADIQLGMVVTIPFGNGNHERKGYVTGLSDKPAFDISKMKELHGTTRAILNNMVHGVSEGFSKKLLINGIGYRAAMRGKTLVLNMGYSHEVLVEPVEGIEYKLFEKSVGTSKTQGIEVFGIDKQVVGQMAAEIRAVREPEPYLGKGIKYENEVILRKEGKRAGKK